MGDLCCKVVVLMVDRGEVARLDMGVASGGEALAHFAIGDVFGVVVVEDSLCCFGHLRLGGSLFVLLLVHRDSDVWEDISGGHVVIERGAASSSRCVASSCWIERNALLGVLDGGAHGVALEFRS